MGGVSGDEDKKERDVEAGLEWDCPRRESLR